MTSLTKPVTRRTVNELGGEFGPDRNRKLVATLVPGKDSVPDMIELRPEGTRRAELVTLKDVYRFAIRCRVGRGQLEKARAKKIKLQATRERQAIARADAKLRKQLKQAKGTP